MSYLRGTKSRFEYGGEERGGNKGETPMATVLQAPCRLVRIPDF
jgi:hypothetical protein